MRDTLLIIHILAASTWIGANATQFLVTPGVSDQGSAVAAHWHRTVIVLMRMLYMPASLILLITGVLLVTAVDDSPYEMSDAFVAVGFVAIFVGAVLAMTFFAPQGRRAADAYEEGDTATAAAIEQKISIGRIIDTVVIVVAVIAMVGTWGV